MPTLWDQRENFVAFAISFAVIGRFWVIHHRFFGEVHSFDGRLIALNLLYLASIVLIPFSSEVLGKYGLYRRCLLALGSACLRRAERCALSLARALSRPRDAAGDALG